MIMKKIVLTMAAVLVMAMGANAQCENGKCCDKKDDANRVERRTQDMAKRYGLSSKQEKKLLALNKEYDGKLAFHGARPHHGHPGMKRGKAEGQDVQKKTAMKRMPASPEKMEQMKKAREEYNTKLKGIMKADQYAKYQKDQELRRQAHHQKLQAKDGEKHFGGKALKERKVIEKAPAPVPNNK